jgi:cobalt ECF transporter T component CbiQ
MGAPSKGDTVSQGLVTTTVLGFTRALSRALISERVARQPGLLQSLDPRVRLVGVLSLVLAVTLSRKLATVGALFFVALLIAIASRVSLAALATRVWLIALGFTGVIALPALFLTPGDAAAISRGGTLVMTKQGIATASLLVARVETAVTLTTMLILCTPWTHVLKALRAFRLPQEAIMMLAMTHRYIFLLIETAGQMFESRQSRSIGELPGYEQRRITARMAGVLLSKSISLSNEVFLAMQSRGFQGDVQLLAEFHMRAWDYLGLLAFLSTGALAVWVGR